VGEAFRQWYALHGQEPGSVMWSMSWFYGMTHLGDPTLFMRIGVEVASVEIVDDGSSGSSGDGDGVPDAGETVALNLTLQNNDPESHESLWVKLTTNSSYILWEVDSVYVGTLPASGTAVAQGFLLSVADDTPDNVNIIVSAEVRDDGNGLWGDTFGLMVEVSGNGDPYADPDEIFDIILEIKNQGGDDSDPSTVVMNNIGAGWVLTSHGTVSIPSIPPGETASTGMPPNRLW